MALTTSEIDQAILASLQRIAMLAEISPVTTLNLTEEEQIALAKGDPILAEEVHEQWLAFLAEAEREIRDVRKLIAEN